MIFRVPGETTVDVEGVVKSNYEAPNDKILVTGGNKSWVSQEDTGEQFQSTH